MLSFSLSATGTFWMILATWPATYRNELNEMGCFPNLCYVQVEGLWLVFLEADQDLNEFLENVHIPVDCEFLVARRRRAHYVLLSEVYRMAPGHPLHCTQFGFWHSDSGLHAPIQSFIKRRSNFHGYNITATSMNVRNYTVCNLELNTFK